MGFFMEQIKSKFSMRKENKQRALKALKEISDEDFKYLTTDKENVLKCASFEEAMAELNWEVTTDSDGNIIDIEFQGEKCNEDFDVMKALGPFVEIGSYIVMMGEDRSTWTWSFDGEECEEIY